MNSIFFRKINITEFSIKNTESIFPLEKKQVNFVSGSIIQKKILLNLSIGCVCMYHIATVMSNEKKNNNNNAGLVCNNVVFVGVLMLKVGENSNTK